MRHNVARSHSQILHLAEFLLIRGLFLLFLILLDRSAFGRVLASVCEAQLRLSVINCFRNSKRFKAIYFFCVHFFSTVKLAMFIIVAIVFIVFLGD